MSEKDYETLVDDIFLDLEKVTYRAYCGLNDDDKDLFANRLRQLADTFQAELYRKKYNICFEKFIVDEPIKEE